MTKKVFVAGGSGFIGAETVRQLLEHGFHVVALARDESRLSAAGSSNLTVVKGDAQDPASLEGVMEGCDVAVNCIGIIREHRRRGITFENIHTAANAHLLSAAGRAGVSRYILVSALGAREDGVSRYQTSKWRAEEAVKNSGLDWTIFRPSLVLGPGKGFLSEILPLVKAPLTPVFGDGRYSYEPVDLRVLAQAIVTAVESGTTRNGTFEFREGAPVTFNELLDDIGSAIGKKAVRKMHIPAALAIPLVRMLSPLPFSPVTIDQLRMLLEGNTGDGRNAITELDLSSYSRAESLDWALRKN